MATAKQNTTQGSKRFIGWQNTPIHQTTFGRTTRGGRRNQTFKILHSTGSVKEYTGKTYLVDASEAPLGRMATVIATILSGKARPTFTPSASSADSVIVINAEKTFFTSNKADKKIYYWHSMYMGGLKSRTARDMIKTKPDRVIWLAVQGMLPKNKISRYQLSRLLIYKGAEHPHAAQKPTRVSLKEGSKRLMKIGAGE